MFPNEILERVSGLISKILINEPEFCSQIFLNFNVCPSHISNAILLRLMILLVLKRKGYIFLTTEKRCEDSHKN